SQKYHHTPPPPRPSRRPIPTAEIFLRLNLAANPFTTQPSFHLKTRRTCLHIRSLCSSLVTGSQPVSCSIPSSWRRSLFREAAVTSSATTSTARSAISPLQPVHLSHTNSIR